MSLQPVITVKNLKINRTLSQETTCYSATVYVDGKKFGEFGNEGHGGDDRCYGFAPGVGYADLDALEKRIAETYPERELGHGLGPVKCDLSWLIMDEIDAAEWLKDYRRAVKGKVLFMVPGEKGVSQIKAKAPHPLERWIAEVKRRYPGAVILNEKPEAEGLALFRENVTVR